MLKEFMPSFFFFFSHRKDWKRLVRRGCRFLSIYEIFLFSFLLISALFLLSWLIKSIMIWDQNDSLMLFLTVCDSRTLLTKPNQNGKRENGRSIQWYYFALKVSICLVWLRLWKRNSGTLSKGNINFCRRKG